jgi:hypothetical protein
MTAAVRYEPIRAPDGRFSTERPTMCSFDEAYSSYHSYLAAVCAYQGLKLREVMKQLAREGRPNFDRDWRAATYARQLAAYLTNTTLNVPQKWLADIAGLTPAAVCLALKAIEDMRDHGDYDVKVDLLAAEMGAHRHVESWSGSLGDRARGKIER